ncbi:hypothetical protein EDE11_1523 [Methylomonas methanica]|uniref:Uncharacterized protein n=1 Tax=Methylomonas methanica TaxID=421 RepID=A0ABY2CKD3_METMH|nr:hypothetical protein A1342_19165 [Methylomonas methanica]TCV72457.1 hypothetical protein EDE11_1523 [Methylomonas methanica]
MFIFRSRPDVQNQPVTHSIRIRRIAAALTSVNTLALKVVLEVDTDSDMRTQLILSLVAGGEPE